MNIVLSCMGQRGWIDAFRAHAEVVTLEEQGLAGEFDLAFDVEQETFADVLRRLPPGFTPDLCVFTSPEYSPFAEGVEESPYPTVCRLGDMHLRAEAALSISRFFDLSVVPEPAAEAMLRKAGAVSVLCFPFYAGDPALYRKLPGATKDIDVCFVGGLDPVIHRRRCKTLEGLLAADSGLRIRVHTGVYGEETNRIYNASKIVFNRSVRGDLNMRVFEAMLSGSLTLYEDDNPIVGSHFRDREHLVLYNDENLLDLVRHYSAADQEREEIAAAGHAHAERDHTLGARAGRLLAELARIEPAAGTRPVANESSAARLSHMASARIAARAPESAARLLARAIDEGGETALLLNDLGVARALSGDLTAAQARFESALDIDPESLAPLLNLGAAHIASGRLTEARESFERLLSAEQSGGSVAGLVLGDKGGMSRFHLERERAIASHPAQTGEDFDNRMRSLIRWTAHGKLGDLAFRAGSTAQARLHYAKALNCVPDCGYTAHKLGVLAESEGKHQAAVRLFAQAVESEPFFGEAQVSLALCLAGQGRRDEAARLSETFGRSNPLLTTSHDRDLRVIASQCPSEDAKEVAQKDLARAEPSRGSAYAAEVARMLDESMQSWAGLEQVASDGDYYDDYWTHNQERADVQRWILDRVFGGPENVRGMKILDVGCGTGSLLEMLAGSNEVVGLDSSDTGIEAARKRGIDVRRCDCSRERFPFGDDTFDIVIFIGTAEHLSDPQFCLEEMRRVLRDGGRMVTSCPNPRLHHVPRPFYPSLFEFDSFNDFLKANGFWIERIFCQGRCLDPELVADEHLKAEEWVHDCLLAKRSRPELQVRLGEDVWNRGKMVEARDCFLRAIEIGPDHADGYYWLGRYFVWQNDFFSRSPYFVSLGLPGVFCNNARKLYGFSRQLGLDDPEKLRRIEADTLRFNASPAASGPVLQASAEARGQQHAAPSDLSLGAQPKQAEVSPRLRILTTLWHEPYMALLAKTGHQFDLIVHREAIGPYGQSWNETSRPRPSNVAVVENPLEVIEGAGRGYDLFLAQTLADLPIMEKIGIPKVFMSHGMLRQELGKIDDETDLTRLREQLRPCLDGAVLVFNDERKRSDWGFDGFVIPGAVDPEEFGGWTGETRAALRVGNLMRERDFALGFSIQERICADGIESRIVGYNPSIPASRHAQSFEELKSFYRTHRLLLHTAIEEYEAGYNLAMLEAMATGMPVVSLYHSRSPIVDGHNGFISADIGELSQRVLELLSDRELAAELGANARRTVVEQFNIKGFLEAWDRVFAAVAASAAKAA